MFDDLRRRLKWSIAGAGTPSSGWRRKTGNRLYFCPAIRSRATRRKCGFVKQQLNRPRHLERAAIADRCGVGSARQTDAAGCMAFVKLDDASGQVEVSVFAELFDACRNKIKEDSLLVIEAKVSYDDYSGGNRIVADKVLDLAEARSRFCQKLALKMNGIRPTASSSAVIWSHSRPKAARWRSTTATTMRNARADAGAEWRVTLRKELLDQPQGLARRRRGQSSIDGLPAMAGRPRLFLHRLFGFVGGLFHRFPGFTRNFAGFFHRAGRSSGFVGHLIAGGPGGIQCCLAGSHGCIGGMGRRSVWPNRPPVWPIVWLAPWAAPCRWFRQEQGPTRQMPAIRSMFFLLVPLGAGRRWPWGCGDQRMSHCFRRPADCGLCCRESRSAAGSVADVRPSRQ